MIKTNKDKRFCVYLHLDTEGIIRYVGSGDSKRPFDKAGRSLAWKAVFSSVPANIVIVEENLSREDALSLEYFMYCACVESGNLLNRQPPNSVIDLDFNQLDSMFYTCSLCDSGLRLKVDGAIRGLKSGDPVGTIRKNGSKYYWKVGVNGKSVSVHRIVYLLTYGEIDPHLVINHIDGNGLNNCITNLEQCTQQQNAIFKLPHSKNNTGINGVQRMVSPRTGAVKFLVTFQYKPTQSFSVLKQGSEERALQMAKNLRDFYTDLLFGYRDTKLEPELIEAIRKEKGILGRTKIKKYGTGFYSQVVLRGRKTHSVGVFPTYEQAIAARDAFVAEYNSKIKVEL